MRVTRREAQRTSTTNHHRLTGGGNAASGLFPTTADLGFTGLLFLSPGVPRQARCFHRPFSSAPAFHAWVGGRSSPHPFPFQPPSGGGSGQPVPTLRWPISFADGARRLEADGPLSGTTVQTSKNRHPLSQPELQKGSNSGKSRNRDGLMRHRHWQRELADYSSARAAAV
jgi:hypothetical protein